MKLKWSANKELSKTDWKVIRNNEQGASDSVLAAKRQAIRDWNNGKEAEILQMTLVELQHADLSYQISALS